MISELPSGWMRAPIGSLCSLVNGRAFKPTEWTTKGVPIVRIQNLNNPAASFNRYQGELDARHRLNGGELLFAWSGTPGTSFGAHIWHGQQAALNQHIFRVDFDERLLDKRFFRFAINEKLNELIGVAQGGVGLRHVTKGVFERTEVAVPPRKEQTRIADQLDTLLARVQACNVRLDAIPALLKRFRQAVLLAAIRGQLSELIADSGSRAIQRVKLGEDELLVPSSWRVIELEAAIDPSRPLCYGVVQPGEEIVDGAPLVRVQDMESGTVLANRLRTVSRTVDDEYRRSRVVGGEVLISVVGTIGRIAVVPNGLNANIARAVARIACREGIAGRWVHYWLSTAPLQSHLLNCSKEVARKTLNLSDLARIPLAVPDPTEQEQIINKVAACFKIADKVEELHRSSRAKARRLTALTLAKAFRGELVQQDPADEPASVLLRRLAGTPTATLKAPRGRPRSKQANQSTRSPTVHPDWAALPADAWAASAQPDEHATVVQLIAVLRASGHPMRQDQVRLATMLCLQPRLFTAALPAHDAAPWRRLVGAEAEPLPASVAALQPAVNTHWRRALGGLRARGDVVASGFGPQDTWSLGPGADRVDTAGWPDGRAGWVVAYLRAHGVEAVLPLLPSAAVDFVHAHAA